MKNRYIILGALLLGTIAQAQINVQSNLNRTINQENPFLDASSYTVLAGNNIGKGLYFPKTDLTKWEFKISSIDPQKFPTYFDGMIVYNTGEGKTLEDTSKGGKQVSVTPGFYYFKNPNQTAPSGSVANGEWVRISDAASNDNIWTNDHTNSLAKLKNLSDGTTPRTDDKNVFITDDGNLGIGTATPSEKFVTTGHASIGVYKKGMATADDLGYGSRLFFNGKIGNTDNLFIARYNKSEDKTQLRVVVGDNDGNFGGDQFVVGTSGDNKNDKYTNEFISRFMVDTNGQVGINTEEPKATLDIVGIPIKEQPDHIPQGVSFPNFTTEERSTFENVKVGTMIFNTTKQCLEMYFGLKGGRPHWDCIPNATSAQSQNVAVVPAGFEGTYIAGVGITTANKVKFELQNNGFSAISNVDFSTAVSLVNGGNVRVNPGQNNNVSLRAGAKTTLSYTLTGTPQEGTLEANFNHLGLTADQQIAVGLGSATIANKDNYTVSMYYQPTNIRIQGKINNGAAKVTIKIPYTNGKGSYNAVQVANISTAPGQGGDTNTLTLDIPAGNFGVTGELTAKITVGGDGEYLVKQMAPGKSYDIATFPINMNGTTYNVVLKGIGGIPDRCFGKTTLDCVGYGANEKEHEFVYVPITGPDGRTWLNNNLGAEYARVGSRYFNPVQQATSKTDWKAYGSLFQWQRNPDGHELINWSASTSGTPKYTGTGSISNSWTNAGTNKFIPYVGWPYGWVNDALNNASTNKNLWQSSGATNPCPSGYHVPTHTEQMALHDAITGRSNGTNYTNSSAMWNETGLRLPASGYRYSGNGALNSQSSGGKFWSSEQNNSSYSWNLWFSSSNSYAGSYNNRAYGFSVRCLKD